MEKCSFPTIEDLQRQKLDREVEIVRLGQQTHLVEALSKQLKAQSTEIGLLRASHEGVQELTNVTKILREEAIEGRDFFQRGMEETRRLRSELRALQETLERARGVQESEIHRGGQEVMESPRPAAGLPPPQPATTPSDEPVTVENWADVANYFLAKGYEAQKPLTPLQLTKLIYIAHGWRLAMTGERLIDARIEAWRYGPVIPDVYQRYKTYGNQVILSSEIDPPPYVKSNLTKAFLDKIFGTYGHFSGAQLSTMTHSPGTPWFETWYNQSGKSCHGTVIKDLLIKEHYALLSRRRAGPRRQEAESEGQIRPRGNPF